MINERNASRIDLGAELTVQEALTWIVTREVNLTQQHKDARPVTLSRVLNGFPMSVRNATSLLEAVIQNGKIVITSDDRRLSEVQCKTLAICEGAPPITLNRTYYLETDRDLDVLRWHKVSLSGPDLIRAFPPTSGAPLSSTMAEANEFYEEVGSRDDLLRTCAIEVAHGSVPVELRPPSLKKAELGESVGASMSRGPRARAAKVLESLYPTGIPEDKTNVEIVRAVQEKDPNKEIPALRLKKDSILRAAGRIS